MFDYGMNLVMIVTGFGVSSVFIVFVCTRLVCARRAALRREQSQDWQTDVELRQRRRTGHGLDELVLANFATTKFNIEDFSSEEDAQCSICLGEYQEGDILRVMPVCEHAFHVTCIDTWLLKQSTCPVCRLSLKDVHDVHQSTSPTFGMTIEIESSDATSITRSTVSDA